MDYQNLVELLKKILEFYANKENYLFFKHKDAPIALDEGSQARFALDKINELSENYKKFEDDFEEQIKNAEHIGSEELLKAIENIKNINNFK